MELENAFLSDNKNLSVSKMLYVFYLATPCPIEEYVSWEIFEEVTFSVSVDRLHFGLGLLDLTKVDIRKIWL